MSTPEQTTAGSSSANAGKNGETKAGGGTSGGVKSMDEIVALCRRRGFIFQSSEIYGGINGFWDYGPLGAQLKRNLKEAWWQDIVQQELSGPDGKPVDIVGLDSTIIMNPKVWVASGHAAGFNDPMVDDKETKQRFRADKAWVVGFWTPSDWGKRKLFQEMAGDYEKNLTMEAASAGVDLNALAPDAGIIIADNERLRQMDDSERVEHLTAIRKQTEIIIAKLRLTPGFGELIDAWLKKENFALDFEPALKKIMTPTLLVAVEADSLEAAHRAAWDRLSKRNRDQIGANSIVEAFNQLNLPNSWDRISPTTQKPTLSEPRQFNLMFETFVGAVQDKESKAWLRPETAQGIFANFWNVCDSTRVRVPFGIAQQGKAFRNEVTPRNFTFRSREFEQMEIEFFIPPESACRAGEPRPTDWYKFWRDLRFRWWQSIGLAGDNLQLREHEKDELAHYAKEGAGTSDIEYRFPFTAPGFGELEGVAHRADFDLKAHATACGKGDKMKYFDQDLQVEMQGAGASKEEIQQKSRYFPHVIEPSAGADRGTLALLCEAYTPDESRASKVYMKFHPRMAPVKAGIFPLVNKDGMPEIAERLYKQLRKRWVVEYDPKQSIGKRYGGMDEAGTPYCFTIDSDTLTNQSVTVRDRDSQTQERVAIDKVEEYLTRRLG